MIESFITQSDVQCDYCSKELPKGSHCSIINDTLLCEDCSIDSQESLDEKLECERLKDLYEND
jgi:hypothetical protein